MLLKERVMYSAVLLDAGGVLLDENEYEDCTRIIITEILERYLGVYSEKRYIEDLEESIYRFSPHNRQYIFWKYSNNDVKVFQKLWKQFDARWEQNVPTLKLMPGISVELQELHNRFKIILAGQYGKDIINLLKENNILSLFENEYSQDDFVITKPDPRYYAEICNRAGVKASECIMVGDRIDKDIIPAKQNGMGTVFVRSGVYKNQQPRTYHEIPNLILSSINGMGKNISSFFG